ncbi:hypothetical protein F2P56_008972 [Juglans regia]|uniref:Protein FAR1-RELATED SEQUENCE n=2 Tax=Juglans regia TaxID=51240 RepID=A0A834D2A8_JUGRE|nr:protein FAR1-RELATED SEQUENCE 5-like [Juglans regia]KAF5472236.1 hypothetical protein F2P56_008972 [Juglans regia]
MFGRAPSTIITDDNKAMAKAIVERSESMNKFFKDYVRSSTMVSDFVHQYEKAVDARYFKEKEKDVRTKSMQAIMKTPFKIEEEAAIVYTRKSFTIFQDKLFNSLRYQARKLYVSGDAKTYGVTAHCKETPIYHVTLEGDEGHAICGSLWGFFVGTSYVFLARKRRKVFKNGEEKLKVLSQTRRS